MSFMNITEHLNGIVDWCRQITASGSESELSGQKRAQLALDAAASVQAGVFLPFLYLCRAFSLRPFEEACLMLAVGIELDPVTEAALARLKSRPDNALLTPGLALSLLGGGVEELTSFLPDAPLRRYCFAASPSSMESGLSHPLKLDPELFGFVLGGNLTDALLAQAAVLRFPEQTAPFMPDVLLERMSACARQNAGVLFNFYGGDEDAQLEAVGAFCAGRDAPMLDLSAGALLELGSEGLLRVERACILNGCIPCLRMTERLLGSGMRETRLGLVRALGAIAPIFFICAEQEWPVPHLPGFFVFSHSFPAADLAERYSMWVRLSEGYPVSEDVSLETLAETTGGGAGLIYAVLENARDRMRQRGAALMDKSDFAWACRHQTAGAVSSCKMVLMPSTFDWEDLILPPRSKELLDAVCRRVGNGLTVYHRWGFGGKLPYGSGLSMLFAGPPGTGKTMGAQVIAHRLAMELYKVNLAAVVSKYIGETEKNLEDIFCQAQEAQAILLFDEADVLFGKRTEIRDSNDKYSNMEAAFLLQKMEEYSGITILATNYVQNFDEAFKRRIKYIIDFPFPDRSYRLLLWQSVFPKETPLAETPDYEFLAEHFELTGSNIKNIAVNAAFEAASAGRAVGMREIVRALRMELAKSGKAVSREELGAYRAMWEVQ
jgi:hypothetical protein